jgi:hypothetical protein
MKGAMTEQRAQQLIEEALTRLPGAGHLVVRAARRISEHRWGARIEYQSGQLRTQISFNEPPGGDRAFRAAAQYELQKFLSLCPLCQAESYVQRMETAATIFFIACPACGEYEILGRDADDLRQGVASDRPDVLAAIPLLIAFVGRHARTPRIENWRTAADEQKRSSR